VICQAIRLQKYILYIDYNDHVIKNRRWFFEHLMVHMSPAFSPCIIPFFIHPGIVESFDDIRSLESSDSPPFMRHFADMGSLGVS